LSPTRSNLRHRGAVRGEPHEESQAPGGAWAGAFRCGLILINNIPVALAYFAATARVRLVCGT
jgi:hypothetical protein